MYSRWFKSSFSGSEHTCVEVRFAGDSVLIRDSKYLGEPGNDPARQPVIEVPVERWKAFLEAATDPGRIVVGDLPVVTSSPFGVSVSASGVVLSFTIAEWAAFTAGIAAGEFLAA
ncbi:DUF397 domain-containing protein [Nocardia cyriacigeorgica]|uniref:DUF397 domain-containing protein n=1 Tax=Nocardia cyriacigeorgica TaxID=135487 RepID=UPI00189313E8|nr:DUF397 domain-containing protein [Nocardia cyriacigeorgica]MBF6439275.1 DUF397 domain-containing protein [Nocardia cyriacigeorgica]